MFNDDWDSVNGNSSRDQMLAEIENLDIVVLSERLKAMKKCESYFESYIVDRKREIEDLSKTDEEKDPVIDVLMKSFMTKKLSKEKEEQITENAYKWYKMKNDSDIIKAIRYRVEELEYDENDDKSRAVVVNTLSKLVEIVFESESLEDLRDCVVEKVNELNFVDLMMFRQSCGNYYIFKVDEFNKLLQDKIPYFSEEELYYYNTRMEDNGDGNNSNILRIKQDKMKELNSRILTNTYSMEMPDFSKFSGLEKVKELIDLKFHANIKVPIKFYDTEEEKEFNEEKDELERRQKVLETKEYKTYIKNLRNLSEIEIVQLLCVQIQNGDFRDVYGEEEEILNQKLKNVSKSGLLTILLNDAEYIKKYDESFIMPNSNFINMCKEKGVFKNKKSYELSASKEEFKTVENISEVYSEFKLRNRINLPWRNLSNVISKEDPFYDENEIENVYLNNYINVKNGIERDISFIKDIITLDKCKDIQLVNIINNLNKKDLYEEQNDNGNEEYKAELNKKKYLVGYLKNRILNMKPVMVSMLEVTENGEFNKHIETVMEQQNFVEDKDFSDR